MLRQEGKTAEAEDQIRTAIGLSPKNAKAHLALANLLATEPDRAAEANAEFDEVRALDVKLLPAPVATTAATLPAEAPATTTASAAGAAAPQVKPLNKLFLLTKNSPVYQNPDTTSSTVGQVRRKKYVHVTGIAGDVSADQTQEWHDRLHPGGGRGVDARRTW